MGKGYNCSFLDINTDRTCKFLIPFSSWSLSFCCSANLWIRMLCECLLKVSFKAKRLAAVSLGIWSLRKINHVENSRMAVPWIGEGGWALRCVLGRGDGCLRWKVSLAGRDEGDRERVLDWTLTSTRKKLDWGWCHQCISPVRLLNILSN